MSDNPFASASAWDVRTGQMLPAGRHVCEVYEIEGGGNSSGGYPQIELKVGNADGEMRDWIVVLPSTIGKVVQLTDAVGIDKPTDDQVRRDGQGFRIDAKYLDQMYGKKVGVIVAPQPDNRNPGQYRDRIVGYVPASQIAQSDVTSASDTAAFSGGAAAAQDDKIPF
jgi:hypothetical protein